MSAWDRIDKQFRKPEIKLECRACGTTQGVRHTPSQTMYHWDGAGDDPNADIPLCELHAAEYTEQMNEQWREYYSGCL